MATRNLLRLSTLLGGLLGRNDVAQAWGGLAHATVGYVAERYVSERTAGWARDILSVGNASSSSSSYLAEVASWADEFRHTADGRFSAAFHYIDAADSPPTRCGVDYDRDCGPDGCSVRAIANYTRLLLRSPSPQSGPEAETEAAAEARAEVAAEAVRFLVHLLGDITQPLHNEALARGGNDITVTFDGHDDNLHSVWDTSMAEKLVGGAELSDARTWAAKLIAAIDNGSYSSQAGSWVQGDDIQEAVKSATAWASDANDLVCTVVVPDGVAAVEKAVDLYPAYYSSAIDTIELQVAKGGYRLANWLDLLADARPTQKRDG